MKQTFDVKGMHCASCAAVIQKQVGKLPGVESCEVNYGTETCTVEYDPEKTPVDHIEHVADKLGYKMQAQ